MTERLMQFCFLFQTLEIRGGKSLRQEKALCESRKPSGRRGQQNLVCTMYVCVYICMYEYFSWEKMTPSYFLRPLPPSPSLPPSLVLLVLLRSSAAVAPYILSRGECSACFLRRIASNCATGINMYLVCASSAGKSVKAMIEQKNMKN